MTQKAVHSVIGPETTERRGKSQFLFIAISLMIIISGLWTLYMGDAPYHPEVSDIGGNAVLAGGE